MSGDAVVLYVALMTVVVLAILAWDRLHDKDDEGDQ